MKRTLAAACGLAALLAACRTSGGAAGPGRPAAFDLVGEVREGTTLAPVAGADVDVETDTGVAVRARSDLAGRFGASVANGTANLAGWSPVAGRKEDAATRIIVRARKGDACAVEAYRSAEVPREPIQLLLVPCDRLKPAYGGVR
jgi:hypothetical protein